MSEELESNEKWVWFCYGVATTIAFEIIAAFVFIMRYRL